MGFLAKELSVVDEETAKNRVFFVSAKEVVTVRQQQRKLEQDQKSKTEVGKGLAEGWRARFMEFERYTHETDIFSMSEACSTLESNDTCVQPNV